MNGWTDGWIGGWVNGWEGGWDLGRRFAAWRGLAHETQGPFKKLEYSMLGGSEDLRLEVTWLEDW